MTLNALSALQGAHSLLAVAADVWQCRDLASAVVGQLLTTATARIVYGACGRRIPHLCLGGGLPVCCGCVVGAVVWMVDRGVCGPPLRSILQGCVASRAVRGYAATLAAETCVYAGGLAIWA